MVSVFTIAEKELRDSVGDRLFLGIYVILLTALILTVIPSAADYKVRSLIPVSESFDKGLKLSVLEDYSASLNKSMKNMIPVFSSLYSLIAVVLSFNSINGEIENGSLKVTLSYPVYRDQVFIGKFLGALSVSFFVSLSSVFASFSVFMFLSGVSLSFDLFVRLLLVVLSTSLYMMVFLSLGFLFSVMFDEPDKSLIYLVLSWIFFIILIQGITSPLINMLLGRYIEMGFEGAKNYGLINYVQQHEQLNTFRNYIYFFDIKQNFVNIIENSLKTLVIQNDVSEGVIVHNIYLNETISQIMPSYFVFLSYIIISTAISYALFNRKEVR